MLSSFSQSGNRDCKLPQRSVKLSRFPTVNDPMYTFSKEFYYAVCAYSKDGIASRCDKDLKVEARVYDITEGEEKAELLTPEGFLVQTRAMKMQYYFFSEVLFVWPGVYKFVVTATSRKYKDVKSVSFIANVRGPNGKGRDGLILEGLEEEQEGKEAGFATGAQVGAITTRHSRSSMAHSPPSQKRSEPPPKAKPKITPHSQHKRLRPTTPLEEKLASLSKNARIRGVIAEETPATIIESRDYILQIPPSLMRLVIRDWQGANKGRKLLPLPREPNVRDALERFQATMRPEDFWGRDLVDKLATAFDMLLEGTLLYTFERTQLRQLREADPKVVPGMIYGSEHLLRLIMILPCHLGDPDLSIKNKMCPASSMYTTKFNVTIDRLMGFLQERTSEFFNVELVKAPANYSSQ